MIDATPLLSAYARYRQLRWGWGAPERVQERVLLRLIRHAAETRFGRSHGFSAIRSVADYQGRVPLRSYEAFWREWWQADFPTHRDVTWPGPIPYFAASSGTTSGATKYIPVSREMIASNRKAALDLLCHHVLNRPTSRILGGKSLVLGGSTELIKRADGVESGDLSGIAAVEVPGWARSRVFPPLELALSPNWDDKIARLAPSSLTQDIRAISGTPSWLLLFFDRVLREAGHTASLAAAYPRLEMIAPGGVSFAPYQNEFASLLAGTHAEIREVYPASEGFIAIQDRTVGAGMRLILDHGIFFEFVPLETLGTGNPVRHWLRTLETGVNYAVVLTTCAGLWSYILGDTVRFLDRQPPRLLMTGRTAYALSAFGEHLIGEEIEAAVSDAAISIAASVRDFAVGPVYPAGPSKPGCHAYIVEFTRPVSTAEAARFGEIVDRLLSQRNLDYRDHRSGGFGMLPPRIAVAPPGSFAGWMRGRGKLGGQNKVPRVITDPRLLQDLTDFVTAATARPRI